MTLHSRPDLPSAYLNPGEVVIRETPAKIVTVLGSCVSVTMFHRDSGLGAICHGVLPSCRRKNLCGGSCDHMFRYLDCALLFMLFACRKRGIPKKELEVKLFGGADTLASKKENAIGSQNVRIALHIMEMEGLKITAADVGDSFGRKLIFFTGTGEVYVKRLKKGAARSINE